MTELETQVNGDAVKLIYRAQCAVEQAVMDQAQRAFAQLVSDLNQAHPGIKLLGITILSTDIKDIKITNPICIS